MAVEQELRRCDRCESQVPWRITRSGIKCTYCGLALDAATKPEPVSTATEHPKPLLPLSLCRSCGERPARWATGRLAKLCETCAEPERAAMRRERADQATRKPTPMPKSEAQRDLEQTLDDLDQRVAQQEREASAEQAPDDLTPVLRSAAEQSVVEQMDEWRREADVVSDQSAAITRQPLPDPGPSEATALALLEAARALDATRAALAAVEPQYSEAKEAFRAAQARYGEAIIASGFWSRQ